MAVSIMFWNVQRAALQNFRRSFKSLTNNYKPTLVVILESQISGIKADDFIQKNGFDKSYRVEVNGFSRGIWLLWKGFFEVDIVLNHKQFIHFKITKNQGLVSWITTIYASLVPSHSKHLLENLGRIVSSIQGLWLVSGDFNSILYASEKQGRSSHNNGVFELFNN